MRKFILIIILNSQFLILNCFSQPYGWYPQNSGTTNNLNHINRSLGNNTFIAVGNNGTILKTTDNGENWTPRPSGTSNNLFFYSNLLIAGSNGTILKTTNQGNSWFLLNTGVSTDLHSISQYIAVGNNGTIIRSSNSGATWFSITSPTTNHLRSILFISSTNGWIVGNNGTILRSTDGGNSWYSYASPTSNNLNSIVHDYYNSILWVAGNNGTILKSTNNGSTWLTLNSGTSSNLYSITAVSSYAWVCGNAGLVLKTTNGGSSWLPQNSGTTRTLNEIFFEGVNFGWAAGDFGTILHTYTDTYVISNKKLDANNISTWFRNNGSFNYDPFNANNPGFEWPKGTNKFARFASGIWIGAKVGNDTLVTQAEYGFEYRPGYTDNNGMPQGQNNPQYIIYKLNYGVNDSGRMYWPNSLLGNSNQGAPVYFDNQTNLWRPLDFGSQTLFYRMTDSYPESHTQYYTAPLKADVMRLDFSLDVPGGLADVAFSQFTVINRSTSTWQNTYFTFWTDDDLGLATDDKVGCDSALNLGYTYNGQPTDPIYGIPPAVGFLFLRGGLIYTGNNNDTVYICINKTRVPLIGHRDQKMSSFIWYQSSNDPCNSQPNNAGEAYRYMSGIKKCGEPFIHPNGYPTKYVFSGDPVTGQGWIQLSESDQRFMMSTGPINMAPGDTQVIVVAQVIARGTSNLNSITRLRELTAVVKNYYNTCYTNPPIGIEPISNELPTRFRLYQNYPNPFNPVTTIKFDLPQFPLNKGGLFTKISIYDAIGREIATLINEPLSPGTYNIEWDATNFPSGVYFYTLSAGTFSESKKLILLK